MQDLCGGGGGGGMNDVHMERSKQSHGPGDITMEDNGFVYWKNGTNPSASYPVGRREEEEEEKEEKTRRNEKKKEKKSFG
jgi:hypothetical protein